MSNKSRSSQKSPVSTNSTQIVRKLTVDSVTPQVRVVRDSVTPVSQFATGRDSVTPIVRNAASDSTVPVRTRPAGFFPMPSAFDYIGWAGTDSARIEWV